MTKKLTKALKKQKRSTKQETPQLTGLLGIPLGGSRVVEVPGRNSYVYVRLRNNQSEVIQAFNNQVAPSYNLPVIIERHGNKNVVIAVDTQRYENNHPSVSPYLPRHGNTHSFDVANGGGGDVVWVYSRQMMPMLVLPSGTAGAPNVIVAPYVLRKENGNWIYVGNTGTQNFSPYIPSSPTGAVMGLVYLDSNGNPQIIINSGSVFSNVLTGTSQIVPYIPTVPSPSSQIPLAAIRLVTGTSSLSWDNIYDVRQWLHTIPTGTGGGSGPSTVITGTTIWDEGVPLGTVGTLNFVGNGVDVSVSGTVARVHITGSTGGGVSNLTGTSVGLPNSPVLTNASGHLNTQPQLKWGLSGAKLFYEFGANETKETNAGRFGYELFSTGYMEWVGAGTASPNRWHRFYDNVKVNNHLQSNSIQNMGLLNSWVYLNATGTEVGPLNAPDVSSVTGTDQILGLNSQNGYSSTRWSVDTMLTTAFVPKGIDPAYISGLNISYLTSGSVSVSPGMAYIPANGRHVILTGTVSASLTPVATTISGSWQNVYLYEDSGVAGVEVNTVAPTTPYAGVARTKSTDSSRRYIGSVYCDTGGFLRKFNSNVQGNMYRVNWTDAASAFPFQFANVSGTVTTPTTISVSWLVPPTAGLVQEILVQTLHSLVAAGDNQIGLSDNADSSTAVAGMEYASRFTNGSASPTISQLASSPIKITSNALKYTHQNVVGTNGGFFRAKGVHIQR